MMANRKRRVAAAAVGVLTVGSLLAGCGDEDGDDGGEQSTASPTKGGGSPSATGSPGGGRLTEDQAERRALIPKVKTPYGKAVSAATGAVSRSKLVSAEIKRNAQDKPVWQTEVATTDGSKRSVDVDAVSGEAEKPRRDDDEDSDDKQKLAKRLSDAKVTPQQAAQTATGRKKGTVSSIELDDNDQNKIIWSVDVVTPRDWNKTTYDIDVSHRKVLRTHVDRD